MNTQMRYISHAALALVAFAVTAADFQVAPGGSDTNPGTGERPFATPERAMRAVRMLVAGGLKSDVRVVFHSGTYPLAAPLVFTSADSGSADHSIIYDVMKTLADGGGYYTLGFQPGTVFRGNLIQDVHRSAYAHGGAPNNGFFIDEGSKGFLFESNVVHQTSGSSVRFNQCQRESHTWNGNAFDGDATAARVATAAQRAGLEPAYKTLQPDLLEGRGK